MTMADDAGLSDFLVGYFGVANLMVSVPATNNQPAPTYRELFKILHGDEYTPEEEMCDE